VLSTQRGLRVDPAFVLGLIPALVFLIERKKKKKKQNEEGLNLFGSECNFL